MAPEGGYVQVVQDSAGGPARYAFAITPANTDLDMTTRGLYIGTGGDVAVILVKDSDPVVFADVPSGTFMPIACLQVRATGTTASDIVGLA